MYTVIIKNLTTGSHTWGGRMYSSLDEYTLENQDELYKCRNDDRLYSSIANEEAQISNNMGVRPSKSLQWSWIMGDHIEVTPLTPRNDHNLEGQKSKDKWCPVVDEESETGYEPHSTYYLVNSSTHTGINIWGSKVKVRGYHEDDFIRCFIIDKDEKIATAYGQEVATAMYPDYPRMVHYADWYLDVEDGKIICPKPPSSAPGYVPNGYYIELETWCNSLETRSLKANWIMTTKDGEEQS